MAVDGFRPLEGLARWVVAALVACIAADVFTIVADWMEIDLLGRAIDGGPVTPSELDASDRRQETAQFLYLVAALVAMVLFLRWFHRAYRNLDELAPGSRRYGTGWAIGAWFFPILNLWRPKKIANDVWRGSAPDPAEAGRPPLVFALWWATWLATTFTLTFSGFVDEDTLTAHRDSDWADLASSVFDIAAAVLAIVVVRTLTSRETARAGSPEAPAALPEPA
jgi:hypothetical protein